MIARPSALGAEVKIDGLPIADQVLHELAWIQNRLAEIDAQVKAKIDAAKEAAKASAVVTIGEASVTLTERADYLRELLQRWTLKHIDKHFEGKKRSVDMAHGKLGLRQIPMVAELAPDETPQSVLDKIDGLGGLIAAMNALLEKKANLGTAKGSDLLDITIKPACKAMKDAMEAKRITPDDLRSIGISIREASDDAVVTPTKIIVTEAA